jgi:hypothetical protein
MTKFKKCSDEWIRERLDWGWAPERIERECGKPVDEARAMMENPPSSPALAATAMSVTSAPAESCRERCLPGWVCERFGWGWSVERIIKEWNIDEAQVRAILETCPEPSVSATKAAPKKPARKSATPKRPGPKKPAPKKAAPKKAPRRNR